MKAKFTKFARSPTCGITQTRREGNALDHSELPFAFGSLCARLAVFHFETKSKFEHRRSRRASHPGLSCVFFKTALLQVGAGLSIPQVGIFATGGDKLLMRAVFGDLA